MAEKSTTMELLATHKGWVIERNPYGLIVASNTDLAFPFIAESVEHAKFAIDNRMAAINQEVPRG